jgi:hypothetical protein
VTSIAIGASTDRRQYRKRLRLDVDLRKWPGKRVHERGRAEGRQQRPLAASDQRDRGPEQAQAGEGGGEERPVDLAADDPEVALGPDPERLPREHR